MVCRQAVGESEETTSNDVHMIRRQKSIINSFVRTMLNGIIVVTVVVVLVCFSLLPL